MHGHPQDTFMVIRSNGSTHTGFPIRNRGSVPNGYQLLGYANTRYGVGRIINPKGK